MNTLRPFLLPTIAVSIVLLTGCPTLPPPPLHPIEHPVPPVAAGVYLLPQVDHPPEPIQKDRPDYPQPLKRSGVVGEVLLCFVVNTEGRAEAVTVIKATDERFVAAALKSIPRWRFSPALRHGEPVPCQLQLPIVFRLD